MDPSGRLLGIGTPPPEPGCGSTDPAGGVSRLEFAGVHILEPELLALFPDDPCDSVRDVYIKKVLGGVPPARGSGRSGLAVFRHAGWWWEFGGLGPFLRGQLDLVRTRRFMEGGTLVERGGAAIWLAPGADLSAGANARGVSVIGQGARVREGAEIEDTVVLGHALIPSHCRLARCIVAEGTVLTGGGRFEDAAISSSPCAAPAALAGAAETGGGRIPPPEGCRAEADLWVRSMPNEAEQPSQHPGARPDSR
jgi:NDP-sugar pyrophosphorylase family protein